jgi:hypothetical protein
MAAVRTLSSSSSLTAVRSHLSFTLRRVEVHPLTGSLVAVFQALLDEWAEHAQTELDLIDRVEDAQVAIIAADDQLNRFADRISKALLTITADDRSHPLYRHYFGNKPLHVFKRPVLGEQLEAMRQWATALAASTHDSLKALAADIVPLIADADKAIKEKANAEEGLSSFRDVGDRKDYIDRVNAARKAAYGQLSTLPHKHIGLPLNFADGFFRRIRVTGEEPEEPTIESVEEEIAALKANLASKEKELAELKEQAKEAQAKEEERAAQLAKLAAIEADVAAKQKEAEALRQALGED